MAAGAHKSDKFTCTGIRRFTHVGSTTQNRTDKYIALFSEQKTRKSFENIEPTLRHQYSLLLPAIDGTNKTMSTVECENRNNNRNWNPNKHWSIVGLFSKNVIMAESSAIICRPAYSVREKLSDFMELMEEACFAAPSIECTLVSSAMR